MCIGEGAFLAFHAARTAETRQIMPAETALMYWQQPADIRSWIDRTGGHQNLPAQGGEIVRGKLRRSCAAEALINHRSAGSPSPRGRGRAETRSRRAEDAGCMLFALGASALLVTCQVPLR